VIADTLSQLLQAGVDDLRAEGLIPADLKPKIELSRPARPEYGEFATNLALAMAGPAKMSPKALAEELRRRLPPSDQVEKVDVAGPGFLNFHLKGTWRQAIVRDIAARGQDYGRSEVGKGIKVQIEFVSANPTGPLHVGSGRNAAYGDAVARLLEAAGYDVFREYYINDAGKQMERFAESLQARYLQALGRKAEVPEGGYQGNYLIKLGQDLAGEYGEGLMGDLERIRRIGTERMVAGHEQTLERFRVRFDHWLSETSLHEAGKVEAGIERLTSAGYTFEQDGALWLRSSELGADRDQVLVRSGAEPVPTYLSADVAYLIDKIDRGFDVVIYVWGADHHGQVAGMQAVAKALKIEEPVEIKLHQMVNFVTPDGQAARMSKRTGTIVTLDELLDEVGVDAARFTLLSRTIDATIDFNLELAKSQSQENPVYYVQYQHARACSILENAKGAGLSPSDHPGAELARLTHDSELSLMRALGEYPALIEDAAELRAPHRLINYAQALANLFSMFYRDCRVLTDDAELSLARLELADATRQVLANTLGTLGVSAPASM
jgi:arginyl-tRNA synthetase